MPKEVITPTHNLRLDTPDGGEYAAQPLIEVSWMRDLADVQIGLHTPARQDGHLHLLDHLYGDNTEQIGDVFLNLIHDLGWKIEHRPDAETGEAVSSERLGRAILDAVTGSDLGYTGWYTHLSERRDVNHLIRQLKRARDGAFGRDE
jgi:hypothetical protein